MTSTPAPTPRPSTNPFGGVFADAARIKRDEKLNEEFDRLDTANALLGSQIGDVIAELFDQADQADTLAEQVDNKRALSDDLAAVLDVLRGNTSTSAVMLTPLQRQALDDIGSGRLFKLPSGAWKDNEWSTRRPPTPAPAPPAPAPAPTPPTPAPAPAAPAATPAPAPTPPTPAPAPAAPAATPAPPKQGGVSRFFKDVLAGLREDPATPAPTPPSGQHTN